MKCGWPLLRMAQQMATTFAEMGNGARLERAMEGLMDALASRGAAAVFSAGDAREFVVATLLLFSYDHALKQERSTASATYIGAPISVGSYLEALLGRSRLLKEAGCAILLDGFVCPLHMVVMRGAVSHDLLLLALQRRCAIVCDRGEFATDATVPRILSSSRDKDLMAVTSLVVKAIYVWVESRGTRARCPV